MNISTSPILTFDQISHLRSILVDQYISLSFGAGVDSTAMMVALKEAGIRPNIITFADTGCEKKITYQHVVAMNAVLKEWGWPQIDVCKKVTLASTGYNDLYGNCIKHETMPSLTFGKKSCSLKYKTDPQNKHIMGAKSGPSKRPPHSIWLSSQCDGKKIIKLLGYDNGTADIRRSAKLADSDAHFRYVYPLQLIGWKRIDCINAITQALGQALVPAKSSCTFCPASKVWELFWLAAEEPAKLEEALYMERLAMTGKHTRYDEALGGGPWLEQIHNPKGFKKSSQVVGLGRSLSWNQWAVTNSVVDENFRVLRTLEDQHRFIEMSDFLRKTDNALDHRTVTSSTPARFIPILFEV